MTGGSINNNSADTKGGGVCVSNTATFIMSGGEITYNDACSGYNAPECGGGIYYASVGETFSCLAEGTMITMADGSHKAIETLKTGDEVLAFDHETGQVTITKVYDLYEYPEKKTGAFTLHFSDDIDVTVIGGHLFYEQESNSYALIQATNVLNYIGHHFYNLDEGRWETLEGFNIITEPVKTLFIATEKQINCITNGMLSNEDGFYSVLGSIFEFDEEMKYDAAKKAADIEKYGLWDYSEAEYVTRETYDALNLQYLNIAVGKGLVTPEEIKAQGAYSSSTYNPELFINNSDETEEIVSVSINSDGMYEVIEEVAPVSRLFMSNPTPSTGITLGGTAVVADNSDSDLFLPAGMTVNLGTGIGGCAVPGLGMYVGVTLKTGTGQITTNGTEADTRFFVPSNSALYTAYDSGHLVLEVIPDDNYVVSITQPENGFVYADKSVAEVDEVITLTYAPAEGYAFASYYVTNQADSVPVDVADDGTFTMPEGGVNVTATFTEIPKYTVSFNVGDHAGSISDMTDVPDGSTITLPTPTPTDAYQFLGWFKEAAFTNQWDADTDTVTANTTLYAKWKAPDPTPTPTPDPTPTPEPEPEEESKEEPEEEQEEQEEQVEEEKEEVPDPLTLPKEEVKADINKGLVVDQKGKSAMLTWGEIPGADGYTVYGAYCGSKKYEKLATIKAGDITEFKASKLGGKSINLKKNTKYYVAAYKLVDGKKVRITKSLLVRMVSNKNDTYTSTEKVELEKDTFKLKKGKKATIKATTLLTDDKKDALTTKYGPEFRYASDNTDVATVSKNGKITAVGKGTCKIWVYSRNGKAVSVDVTVK